MKSSFHWVVLMDSCRFTVCVLIRMMNGDLTETRSSAQLPEMCPLTTDTLRLLLLNVDACVCVS